MKKGMKQNIGLLSVVVMLVALALTGCASTPEAVAEEGVSPVTIERLEGKVPTRETLTEDAAKRIDIQTEAVRSVQVDTAQLNAVPYSAIIYDINGNTWLYTSPEALVFERTPLVIDHIDGDNVFFTDGPSVGTAVVTRGVAELYGAETEFEEE
jgi:hypothetical protein